MATLATQQIVPSGLAPTFAPAAAGGDEFTPGDNVQLWIKNGGGSPITATVATPGSVGDLAIADRTVTVAAGGEEIAGPFTAQTYAGADGKADISWSATTSVTVAVLKL